MPPRATGPPLRTHACDETCYVLEGEVTFQLVDQLTSTERVRSSSPQAAHHTRLANRGDAPARVMIVCTPAGFEREMARRAAALAAVEPPAWALQPIPEATVLGRASAKHR
jgi:hypothetical protein